MERWERWTPVDCLPSIIYNNSLIDNREGLTLEFNDGYSEIKIIIRFEFGALTYSNTDKGYLVETINYLQNNYDKTFFSSWPLFKVTNSKYLKWFLEESSDLYESKEISHYVFLTQNDVIEVLSIHTPLITIE
ncbi:hypothetical protein ACSVDA_21530 [Cytobacillus sp. Hm23]